LIKNSSSYFHNTTQHNTTQHSQWNDEEEAKKAQILKRQKLEAYEQIKQQKKALELKTETEGGNEKQKKDKKSESFFSKLTQTIINNLQVIVRNVHVRYEDYTTDPKVCLFVCFFWNLVFLHDLNNILLLRITIDIFYFFHQTHIALFFLNNK